MWADHLAAGVFAVCPVVELEFLFSARSLADRLQKQRLLREAFSWVPMSERAFERAGDVEQCLTESGGHRSAGPVDRLIAATAVNEQLRIPCGGKDYRTVAAITGQSVRLLMVS